MALWLQIILALVLVVLCACLVYLLLQLRTTAASVQQLADSARQDIHQIAGDIHQISARADALADKANACLDLPAGIGRAASGLLGQLQGSLDAELPTWLGILLTGLKFVLNLMRRKPDPA